MFLSHPHESYLVTLICAHWQMLPDLLTLTKRQIHKLEVLALSSVEGYMHKLSP